MDEELQRMADYIAIRELSGRYTRYADAADGEAYAGLFTPGGFLEIADRGQRFVGSEQLAGVCVAMKGVYHVTADPLVDIDGDKARQSSRLLIFAPSEDGTAENFVLTATYDDELVRTGDGWRFKSRTVRSDLRPAG